ncbi:MAG: hypothetical protein J07HQW1_00416 [Haloquadratum walsbyi J07HQW1]|uniref:DUF7310 domain-containing protein n=1 Tax=Haloquadratum walsbyi J07HQW1 TaxID=1238424 RepID=U1N1R4_9EURY|nr:MAG: hypothetical protein J07HQW1_00416 [Haloquadratum walsbyi J07HQW1]
MDSADDALAARLDAVERAVSESTMTDPIDSVGESPNHNGGVTLSSVPDLHAIDTPAGIEYNDSNSESAVGENTVGPEDTPPAPETNGNRSSSSSVSNEQTSATATDTDTDADTSTDAEITTRVGDIESRLNSITGELAAIRGLIESVTAIDEAVEQRANIALAKIEAIESERGEDTTQNTTTESETVHSKRQYGKHETSAEPSSTTNSDQLSHETSTCAVCGETPTPTAPRHSGSRDAVKQRSTPQSTATEDTPTRSKSTTGSEPQSHQDHTVSEREELTESYTDDTETTSLAARLRAAFE